MDSSSVCDENSESDFQHSPEEELESTNTEAGCSTPTLDSHHRGWPKFKLIGRTSPVLNKLSIKQRGDILDRKPASDDLELIKEKFSKLLLGEDMSGSGKGVCTAVAISNAITNLYASVFGSCHKLEPLSPEKKSMWRREMVCLLSVCDYIVEFLPSSQSLPDGSTVEVMATRPRTDMYVNLPALEKLDALLIGTLDSFQKTEFWYLDEKMQSFNDLSKSPQRSIPRSEEKWWVPVLCLPCSGLPERARKDLCLMFRVDEQVSVTRSTNTCRH